MYQHAYKRAIYIPLKKLGKKRERRARKERTYRSGVVFLGARAAHVSSTRIIHKVVVITSCSQPIYKAFL